MKSAPNKVLYKPRAIGEKSKTNSQYCEIAELVSEQLDDFDTKETEPKYQSDRFPYNRNHIVNI